MAGNTFGQMFKVTTCGESHGLALAAIVDGCPPGLELSEADLQPDLDRRRPGTSKFTTMRQEADQVKIISGVFEGKTTGTPIGLVIENTDQRSGDYSSISKMFRPGHADYTYLLKYGIVIEGYTSQIGPVVAENINAIEAKNNEFFFGDASKIEAIRDFMSDLLKEHDSIGAKVEVIAHNVPFNKTQIEAQ